MKILIVQAHPRADSYCGALARAYGEGARAAGMQVENLFLSSLIFDPDVHAVSPRDQPLEPDLQRAQALIAWAEHLVFVFPNWWGVGPARLKGFLDRVLTPGFAFAEKSEAGFEGLLQGKTAHLILTMDMPVWVYRLIFRAPGHNAMKRSTLGFCGIETTRIVSLGPVKDSTPVQRDAWLMRVRALGLSLRQGPRSRCERIRIKALDWLKALRLQFYPMGWIAYSVGALGAVRAGHAWDGGSYWLGYAYLFFIEAATVFANDYFDYSSDRVNRNAGIFTGGSRVLVEGGLSFRALRGGMLAALLLAALCAGLLLERLAGAAALPWLLLMAVLGLGYTVPPLKLAWRGLGELNVGLTHSLGVILCGYVIQGGAWNAAFPWLVSLPLFLAVLPAIILSGLPDLDADRRAGKATLPVRLGPRRAMSLGILAAVAAALSVLSLRGLEVLQGSFQGLLPWVLPHVLLLVWLLVRQLRRQGPAARMDGLMIVALSYILWFGLIPLLRLS